jgi:hypothetical protein
MAALRDTALEFEERQKGMMNKDKPQGNQTCSTGVLQVSIHSEVNALTSLVVS